MTTRVLKTFLLPVFLFTSTLFIAPASLDAGAIDTLAQLTAGTEIPPFPAPFSAPVAPPAGKPGRPLKVYFLNVGQGDAAYIELPSGHNALIDGGPSKAKDGYLAEFLSEHHVDRIDNVVLTHPHADHYTGLRYVFSALQVGSFYDTRLNNTSTGVDEALRKQVSSLGVKTVYPSAGDMLDWDGDIKVKVLNSCSEPLQSDAGRTVNDCSIVLKITYQDTSMLFTGDMQDDTEKVLVARYGQELKADMLKVGHHGSPYSTSAAFLAAVRPHYAVISVGADNNYGHPASIILSRLQASGAVIHRTDTEGTMEYTVSDRASFFSLSDSIASLRY